VFGLLELVGVEVAGSLTVALAGPVLGIATFLRGILIASEQQRRAAEGVGVVLAWFAVSAVANDPAAPPEKLTRERVDLEVERDNWPLSLRDAQRRYAGTAPHAVDEGFSVGINRVLVPLNEALGRVDGAAAGAHERMIVQARLTQGDETLLTKKFPVAWWKLELRRRVYVELAARLRTDALALHARFTGRTAGADK
jgi:hypothetical protein